MTRKFNSLAVLGTAGMMILLFTGCGDSQLQSHAPPAVNPHSTPRVQQSNSEITPRAPTGENNPLSPSGQTDQTQSTQTDPNPVPETSEISMTLWAKAMDPDEFKKGPLGASKPVLVYFDKPDLKNLSLL